MALRFGTDGVRGVANAELTPEFALCLGRAAARIVHPDTWVIGRDTRRSGTLLEAALAAGMASEGARVELVGVVPTPAVARASQGRGAGGAMISASHNPFPDNGIKLFAPGGRKLPDDVEEQLEAELDRLLAGGRVVGSHLPTGAGVGEIHGGDALAASARIAYVDALVATLEGRRLEGLRVVLDAAHGAGFQVGPEVLGRLGADVVVLHDSPDGCNINDGVGSTDLRALQAAVVAHQAHVGLALDGDADRVLAVDAAGAPVDGDQLIVLLALDRRHRNQLAHHTVVVTVMANLGLHRALAEAGIAVVQTAVGDRYVLEAIDAGGYSLGGEQSGHVIFRDLATTGDGLLTGIQVLDTMLRSGRTLAELAGAMTRFPQVLVNVRVGQRRADIAEALALDIARVQAELGEGRVLVRPSGTEPLVRVMVEAADEALARRCADALAQIVSQR